MNYGVLSLPFSAFFCLFPPFPAFFRTSPSNRGVVYLERDSRTESRESTAAGAATRHLEGDFVAWESYREQRAGYRYGRICGEKAKVSLCEAGDVSVWRANSWVGRFAPSSRLPGRDSNFRPVSERCTAVLCPDEQWSSHRVAQLYEKAVKVEVCGAAATIMLLCSRRATSRLS